MKSLGNPVIMKEINTDIIRSVLKTERQATKQRLSELTGLSIVTAGAILNQLVLCGEVFETDMLPSGGGRPAQNFCYNENFSHVLILYSHVCSGEDTVFCRVINLYGECVYEENVPAGTVSLERFEPLIDGLLEKYPDIKAVGFGLPGTEYDGVIIVNDYNLLNDTRFTKHYREKYGIPVIVENDVNLAVLGYCNTHREELAPDTASVVYIYFPQKYAPGAGIYLNGNLYTGKNGLAGEIAYILPQTDWKQLDYSSFNTVCEVISNIVTSLACILNPHRVVLCGEFLQNEHLSSISRQCGQRLKPLFVPLICFSENFNADFESGLSSRTLELLHPRAKYN